MDDAALDSELEVRPAGGLPDAIRANTQHHAGIQPQNLLQALRVVVMFGDDFGLIFTVSVTRNFDGLIGW